MLMLMLLLTPMLTLMLTLTPMLTLTLPSTMSSVVVAWRVDPPLLCVAARGRACPATHLKNLALLICAYVVERETDGVCVSR